MSEFTPERMAEILANMKRTQVLRAMIVDGVDVPVYDSDIIAGHINSLENRIAELEEALSGKTMHDARNEALEDAARVAEYAHMVPPDGGSPTKEEADVAINAAAAIRALKT